MDAGSVEALAELFADWLRFYGALPVARLAAAFGLGRAAADAAVARLAAAERAVAGTLVEGSEETWVARLDNFETLLRWRRAEARPELAPLPLRTLPLFLAEHQGLTAAESGVEGAQRAFDRLFGWAAPAALWEGEILPARIAGYQTGWLDALCEEHALRWIGVGRERVAFALEGELALVAAASADGEREAPWTEEESPEGHRYDRLEELLVGLLAAHPRGLEAGELAGEVDLSRATVERALWELAWRGRVANESMRALRAGALARFEPQPPEPAAARGSRSFRRWSPARGAAGRWRLLPRSAAEDALAGVRAARERARLVLDRYGVVFRELLAQEAPLFAWARLARALRALELSGEIVSGHFFAGVPGLQFATFEAVRRLRAGLSANALWWINALDPASPCGLDLPELKAGLPRRLPGSHLAYRGAELLLVSRASGRELELATAPDDPVNRELLAPLRSALTRSFDPERAIDVETINGEAAGSSPYLPAFADFSVTREGSGLRLRRRYAGGVGGARGG